MCSFSIHHWKGDLNKFADTAVLLLKNDLVRNNISVDDKGEKSLKLSIKKAACDIGIQVGQKSTIILQVETGDGLIKQYDQSPLYDNGAMTTWAMETILKNCLMDMLKDKEILSYLEN